MNDETEIEPYENKLTFEELREEVRRCWDAHHELSMALKTLPDMPGHGALRLLNDYPRGAWPRVWELGKEEQRRLTDGPGVHFDDAKNVIPYKTEYEIAAGIWLVIRDALRKEFAIRACQMPSWMGRND